MQGGLYPPAYGAPYGREYGGPPGARACVLASASPRRPIGIAHRIRCSRRDPAAWRQARGASHMAADVRHDGDPFGGVAPRCCCASCGEALMRELAARALVRARANVCTRS